MDQTKSSQPMKTTDPRRGPLFFIELGVLFVLLMLKGCMFYSYIGLEAYAFPVALLTACFFLLVGALLLLIPRVNPTTVLWILYIILSIIMFIDRVYFSYFSALPKIKKILLAKYLAGVGNSVSSLISWRTVGYLADIPLVLVWLIALRRRCARALTYKAPRKLTLTKCLLPMAAVALGGLSYLYIGAAGGYYAAAKSELWRYHAADIGATILGSKGSDESDPTDYIHHDIDSKYAGIAKGRNLINIQVEALNAFVIGLKYDGVEITPNLNKLLEADTLYFDNYYWTVIGGGGTSDAEFSVNNSLYSTPEDAAYESFTDKHYYGIPYILKDNGYTGAHVFHGYIAEYWNRDKAYPYQGFDTYINANQFDNSEKIGMGVCDKSFFKQCMPYLESYEEPFYAFLITLSSHHPFIMPLSYQELPLRAEHYGTLFGNYLESVHYADAALGEFIQQLKDAGLYDRSLITIYGDHYGVNTKIDDGFTAQVIGREYDNNEIFKVPLIIHIPGSGVCETVHKTGSHVDYEPTVLALLGIENNRAIMAGQNLLSDKTVGHVYGQNQMALGGFITDTVFAEMTGSGLKVKDKNTGRELNASDYQEESDKAVKTIEDIQRFIREDKIVLGTQN